MTSSLQEVTSLWWQSGQTSNDNGFNEFCENFIICILSCLFVKSPLWYHLSVKWQIKRRSKCQQWIWLILWVLKVCSLSYYGNTWLKTKIFIFIFKLQNLNVLHTKNDLLVLVILNTIVAYAYISYIIHLINQCQSCSCFCVPYLVKLIVWAERLSKHKHIRFLFLNCWIQKVLF